MDNPAPVVGDIWLWCGHTYVLVLGYDEVECCWRGLNLNSGVIGDWTLETQGYVECYDWRLVA